MSSRELPDDPRIAEVMRWGMPEGREPICPVCFEECDTVYLADSDVIGCDNCITTGDSDEWTNRGEIEPCQPFICPCCGEVVPFTENVRIYLDLKDNVLGCEDCVDIRDATEVEECFYRDNED